jgi:hypothetical protein
MKRKAIGMTKHMIDKIRTLVIFCAAFAAVTLPSTLMADETSHISVLKPFFGAFEGVSLRPRSETRSRDLKVIIRPVGDSGFAVDWQTTLYKEDGAEPKTQSLSFVPQGAGFPYYVATASGLNVGIAPTRSPFDGAPFSWANIINNVLTVNVLTIAVNGDWVMQTYERALTKEGLALSFTRVVNGDVAKRLWGTLERMPD